MARRIVIIQGHPDADPHRLCRALADSYAEGAAAAGHEVARIDLATLDFPLLRSKAEFDNEPIPASLQPAVAALRGADHLVLVFPLWLGTMPALVQAFLEHVVRPQAAAEPGAKASPGKLLSGRSVRLVVTMGMPAQIYRWWFHAPGIKLLERNILAFVGVTSVRKTLFGMIETVSPGKRESWLKQMRKLGAEGA